MKKSAVQFSSSYRIQFHSEFTFADLKQIQQYLEKLGIGAIYASPLFKAVPGSTHGYDVVDAASINPELGSGRQLRDLILQLESRGIGWIQDIVPNHMGYHPENVWVLDLLEKGEKSRYASFFDTSLAGRFFQGRLMAPFLGTTLEEALDRRDLQIAYRKDRLMLIYHDQEWPLHPESYRLVWQVRRNGTPKRLTALQKGFEELKDTRDARSYSQRWDDLRIQLAVLLKTGSARRHLRACLEEINQSPPLLQTIAAAQVYRLCSWRESDERINYRRFFTINGLICLNMQKRNVFRQYHKLVSGLLKEKLFNGIRVDHIDGLFDPANYLADLRNLTGSETWITVEKILEQDEKLPESWPVQGTTGYDFLALVNNLLTWPGSRDDFTRFYQTVPGSPMEPLAVQIRNKKAAILQTHMQGELDSLARLFRKLLSRNEAEGEPVGPDSGSPDARLKDALAAFLTYFPVYRYYGNRFPLPDDESESLRGVFKEISKDHPELKRGLSDLEEVFIRRPPSEDPSFNRKALHFYQRCMQFTGPLMAKGVEDTLMYTHHRFIAHNEVGDSPDAFGISPEAFHVAMKERAETWPQALNATATHDTKRGEDIRARLNVLSCIPSEWMERVHYWRQVNQELKQNGFPDENDAYFIYQTLAGAWPYQPADRAKFGDRLREYLVKVVREAKVHSSWSDPNPEYESAITAFSAALLDEESPFLKNFKDFIQRIEPFGTLNSLSQVLLKCTCPGIPDIYQGGELWDFNLVDPDNRRPVDYAQRTVWLKELQTNGGAPDTSLEGLWKDRASGRIKLWLTQKLLRERKQHPWPFLQGDYIPLRVSGALNEHVLAFARRHDTRWYITVVSLHLARRGTFQKNEPADIDWGDTVVVLPPEAPVQWKQILDGTKGVATTGLAESDALTIPVGEIFSKIPLALLQLIPAAKDRSAGILLHLTSLSSPRFDTGDLGKSAQEFAGFLSRAGQRYWQLLPVNPVAPEHGYSPYSPTSAMAGNPLLIDPENLVEAGWLSDMDLNHHALSDRPAASLEAAFGNRDALLQKAWENYRRHRTPGQARLFRTFCAAEKDWIHDFALFMALKKEFKDTPWYAWPEKFKSRDRAALREFGVNRQDWLEKEKWFQYIFASQWQRFRTHCARQGIRIFGDLPFYIGYNSADVWSHREIFSLDERGNRLQVAGVPPDYFNSAGQLWGMPVFRWDALKASGYRWWVRRIQKNLDWFDLLRLDHFRAFSAYWEVPSTEKTAINGQWKPGPGADLFETLQKKLGTLPFVAEDLGDIDEEVHRLRERFGFPGMKVLQFAFGEDQARSPHIPHQYRPEFLVYTGTHDNNTTRGWFEKELDPAARERLSAYAGQEVHAENVHRVLARLAYASVAKTAILPMQDVLGLDETARMNVPATEKGNWTWRMDPAQLSPGIEEALRAFVKRYGRG